MRISRVLMRRPIGTCLNARSIRCAEGCAWSFSGLEAGIDSCAVAVRDTRGEVLAALSVAGPNTAFSADADLRAKVESSVKAAANALSGAAF